MPLLCVPCTTARKARKSEGEVVPIVTRDIVQQQPSDQQQSLQPDASQNDVPETTTKNVETTCVLYTMGVCPFSQAVRIALEASSIVYQLETVQREDLQSDWFKRLNPASTVPVLAIWAKQDYQSGKPPSVEQLPKTTVTSSADAVRFAEQSSVDTEGRETGSLIEEEWFKFATEEFAPAFMKVIMGSNPQVQKEWRPKLTEALDKLSARLKKTADEHKHTATPAFILGNTYTKADIYLTPFLSRLPMLEYFRDITLSSAQAPIIQYVSRLESHPAYQRANIPLAKIKEAWKKVVPMLLPLSAGQIQHRCIRFYMTKTLTSAKELTRAYSKERASQLDSEFSNLTLLIKEHSMFEDEIMYPVFEQSKPGSTKPFTEDHTHEVPLFEEQERNIKLALEAENSDEWSKIAENIEKLQKGMLDHMAGEETHLFPIMQTLSPTENASLFEKVYNHCGPFRSRLLVFLLKGLSKTDRHQYLHNIKEVISKKDQEEWSRVQMYVKDGFSDDIPAYEDLCERISGLLL